MHLNLYSSLCELLIDMINFKVKKNNTHYELICQWSSIKLAKGHTVVNITVQSDTELPSKKVFLYQGKTFIRVCHFFMSENLKVIQ